MGGCADTLNPIGFFFMAKDPAVLLYTSDFLSSTITMTNEEVGMFIRLLCLQHQKGKLSEKDMQSICSGYVQDVYEKFELIDGFYINQRMYEEAEKRSKYTESRRNNASAKHMQKHMPNHMENEIENVNEVEIKNKSKFKKPDLLEVHQYFQEQENPNEAEKFFNYYESNGWKVGKNPMKDWKAASRNWIKNAKNFKTNDTTKTSIDHYNERRDNLHRIAAIIDAERGIKP